MIPLPYANRVLQQMVYVVNMEIGYWQYEQRISALHTVPMRLHYELTSTSKVVIVMDESYHKPHPTDVAQGHQFATSSLSCWDTHGHLIASLTSHLSLPKCIFHNIY